MKDWLQIGLWVFGLIFGVVLFSLLLFLLSPGGWIIVAYLLFIN